MDDQMTPPPHVEVEPLPIAVATPSPAMTTPSPITATPPTPEPQWPEMKPKSKVPQILGAIAAIVLVLGVATAAYFVSNRISGRQAVAPTAPESKPMAAGGCLKNPSQCSASEYCNSAGQCKPKPKAAVTAYQCTPTNCPSPEFYCSSSTNCVKRTSVAATSPTTTPRVTGTCADLGFTDPACICTDYSEGTCNKCSCPGSVSTSVTTVCTIGATCSTSSGTGVCKAGARGTTYCLVTTSATPTLKSASGLGTATGGVAVTPTVPPCDAGQTCRQAACAVGETATRSCKTSHGETGVCCVTSGTTSGGGGGAVVTTGGKKTTGGGGGAVVTTGGATCPADTAGSKSITFSKAGTVHALTRNFKGTITLVGPKTITLTGGTMKTAEEISQPFAVSAGETYTIAFKWDVETGPGNGWIPPKSKYECGPGAVACGGVADIKPLIDLAEASYDLAGITAGAKTANVQCWGDKAAGDATQDFDYNDGTLALGYEKAGGLVAGACVEVNLFVKTADGYSTTPMTAEQKKSLHVGDKIRIGITGSKADLKTRFRVKINEIVEQTGDSASPEWRAGQAFSAADHLTTYYSDYEIKQPGNYKFEGEVSTKP